MRIYYPKLRNIAHALSLSIFIAFKGTNFYIQNFKCLQWLTSAAEQASSYLTCLETLVAVFLLHAHRAYIT